MTNHENRKQDFSAAALSDEKLEQVVGGQSLTQPASVSGTLGQTVGVRSCPLCGYSTSSEEDMAQHMASCKGSGMDAMQMVFARLRAFFLKK